MAPLELGIDRFCNLVQFWATRQMDEEEANRFLESLDDRVGGRAPGEQLERASGAWSREAELSQFKQASR